MKTTKKLVEIAILVGGKRTTTIAQAHWAKGGLVAIPAQAAAGWSLTHAGSGYAVGFFLTLADATKCGLEILPLGRWRKGKVARGSEIATNEERVKIAASITSNGGRGPADSVSTVPFDGAGR